MNFEEKAKMIADQCKPCTDDFYNGIYQGVLLALKAESRNLEKAKKWDELDDEIAKFYPDDEEEECDGDLGDIGELCARKFGFM
jgi:hypothetical protein